MKTKAEAQELLNLDHLLLMLTWWDISAEDMTTIRGILLKYLPRYYSKNFDHRGGTIGAIYADYVRKYGKGVPLPKEAYKAEIIPFERKGEGVE